jgi:hypothetical protein
MKKYEFVVKWFKTHPGVRYSNSEIEQHLREDYKKQFGKDFRDPLRAARTAHQNGIVHRSPRGPNQFYVYQPEEL